MAMDLDVGAAYREAGPVARFATGLFAATTLGLLVATCAGGLGVFAV